MLRVTTITARAAANLSMTDVLDLPERCQRLQEERQRSHKGLSDGKTCV